MFHISALPRSRFEHLFPLSDEELEAHDALRRVATTRPGFPCRISLEDAEPGEEVLLVNFRHQDARTPFRASHAVYVRPNANQAELQEGEVPELLRSRILSLRAFDAAGMMLDADLTDGREVEHCIRKLLARADVAYLHLHSAKPGCYLARVSRSPSSISHSAPLR